MDEQVEATGYEPFEAFFVTVVEAFVESDVPWGDDLSIFSEREDAFCPVAGGGVASVWVLGGGMGSVGGSLEGGGDVVEGEAPCCRRPSVEFLF